MRGSAVRKRRGREGKLFFSRLEVRKIHFFIKHRPGDEGKGLERGGEKKENGIKNPEGQLRNPTASPNIESLLFFIELVDLFWVFFFS